MNTQLQQAMAAVKAEPNNAESWFLLSQAVDTDKERTKLLRKVLALNPNHPAAREQLAELTTPAAPVQVAIAETVGGVAEAASPAEEATPLPISTNPLDFVAQSAADTIPPWMAGDTAVSSTRVVAEPAPAAAAIPPEELPTWLKEEPSQSWLGEEDGKTGRVVWKAGQQNGSEGEVAVEAVSEPDPAPVKAKPAAQGSFWTSNAMLALLGIVAVLLLVAIVFVWLGS